MKTRVLRGKAMWEDSLGKPPAVLEYHAMRNLCSAVRNAAEKNLKLYHDDKNERWVCTCEITIVEGKT